MTLAQSKHKENILRSRFLWDVSCTWKENDIKLHIFKIYHQCFVFVSVALSPSLFAQSAETPALLTLPKPCYCLPKNILNNLKFTTTTFIHNVHLCWKHTVPCVWGFNKTPNNPSLPVMGLVEDILVIQLQLFLLQSDNIRASDT